jgi:hypothetical protein
LGGKNAMKRAFAVFALIAGCTATPNLERVALQSAQEPPPECQLGREAALIKDVVTVRPGETICISVEVRGNRIVPLKVESAATQSTIVFKAWRDGNDTFLRVQNPLSTYLRYEAAMARADRAFQLEYTSTCPVLSGGRFALEHWPYPIAAFALSSFTAMPESDQMECK